MGFKTNIKGKVNIGKTNKKFINADLNSFGIKAPKGSYLFVNSDGKSYKIKTNYTGENKKLHISKDIYQLLQVLISQLNEQ